MSIDPFIEAVREEAERRSPHDPEGYTTSEARGEFRAGAAWARDHLAGQEPRVQHLWRPGEPLTAFCGDESARLWESITPEESASVPVCARCYLRAMHEARDVWAAQEPTDAEVEAAAEAWEAHTHAEFHEDEGEMCCRECGEAFDWIPLDGRRFAARQRAHRIRAALSAARAARREETR